MSNESQSLSAGVLDAEPWYRSSSAWLRATAERTTALLVYSTLYLVLIAMVEAMLVVVVLGLPLSAAPLVVGLLTFSVYAGDRIADLETDELTTPGQTAFVRRHERVLSLLTAATYGLAIAISLAAGPLAFALTLLPGAFWVLYASDWLPTLGAYFKRLKDVLVVNTTIVALAWAITLTLFPVVYVDGAITPTVAVVFAYFFLDRFVNTELPNLKDVPGDAAIGVSTLPVVFGERRTRWILYGLSLGILGLVVFAYQTGLFPLAFTLALLVGVAYTVAVTGFVGRTAQYRRLAIASECKHLVVFAAFVALTLPPL